MSNSLEIIIVDKTGVLKSITVKDFKEDELFKKCGFKKADGFESQVEWKVKVGGIKYRISIHAKTDGRANSENKYDFPPPIDNHLFFGSCAITAKTDANVYTDLSLELWNKVYEKLFGGFEDLAATALEDEMEEDELAHVPKEKKTKQGYLKDGFVVDSGEDDEEEESDCSDGDEEEEEEEDDDDVDETVGSELSEDSYE
jgi:hypothetical protein